MISTARYNVITFLPLNLFTQFRRLANIYFLIVVAVQFIPDVSPFSVYISIMPLAFILTVTAIKDGNSLFKNILFIVWQKTFC